ncbi:MAG TPA: L-threonylcarbamoyladenylate synthase [Bacteroidales bacterium]|nr:MAG: Threonylcarbamoyl-AMP synthase [Bacteroidetes bacterium ADurb.Bin217]HOS84267.1 L-threonylcarbamoyladenylate synthase [Bacteroidales bacterium]HPH16523.1 L-threonylcarbamoyladenylate synthase [Bacteroidales bacterium]HPM12952.1 L-threonylcarbamoyladenylate synthase [Bacteroidales bacterium]
MAQYFKLYNENPNERTVKQIVEILRNGGVIIYPTDTVYGLGCDIFNHKAVERIARIKGVKLEKANFSFICYDLSHLSDFTKSVDNQTYKLMKKHLPGPFTFILQANSNVPKLFKSKKKTVGIRIPNNNICREIVRELGNPILTTSVKNVDDILEYTTDPELLKEEFDNLVDAVVDGGYGNNVPSTIVNCSEGEFEIIRQGIGELD